MECQAFKIQEAYMHKACVIGHPIHHSKSPVLHGFWLNKYQLHGVYGIEDIHPDRLGDFIKLLRNNEYQGCNVTIPHKETIIAHVDHLSEEAKRIGAVNTLWVEEGVIYGTNTDGFGFISHLKEQCPDEVSAIKTAIVLGAGGAARAVIDALCAQGLKKLILLNRSVDKAKKLALHFSQYWQNTEFVTDKLEHAYQYCSEADLVVNTTSLGMTGQPKLDIDLSNCKKTAIAYDLVYAPLETEFLKQANKNGLQCIDGLGMLLHQGRPGFEKWFGVFPEVDDDLKAKILSAK